MGTQYSTMKVLILTSAMLALAASDSCSDCTAVVSHIADRLSTPESLAAQGEILVGELCPGAPDPEACVSGLPGLWNQIAAILWPGYWDPTAECPAAVDVIIRQGLPALVAAGSDGDFGQAC